MKNTILREAIRIALEKLDRHPQKEFYMHYSFIVQNNKLINWNYNLPIEPPKHYGYHQRVREGLPKLHAEIAAFNASKGIMDKNKSFEIINIRVKKDGTLNIAAPCSCCYHLLKELGCSKFYYSSDVGFLTIT